MYTAKRHGYVRPAQTGIGDGTETRGALGIITGGAPCDQGFPAFTAAREKQFPFKIIVKSLLIKVEEAEASNELDRVHILNSLRGILESGINDDPPLTHEKFDAFNQALRGRFVSNQSTLIAAWKKGVYAEWMLALLSLSEVPLKGEMDFNFIERGDWSGLPAVQATQLAEHLPLTIEKLSVWHADFGLNFIESLIQRVEQMSDLTYLCLGYTNARGKDGQKAGSFLAKLLTFNKSIKILRLTNTDLVGLTNLTEWGDALAKNMTLSKLDMPGVSENIKEYLRVRLQNHGEICIS